MTFRRRIYKLKALKALEKARDAFTEERKTPKDIDSLRRQYFEKHVPLAKKLPGTGNMR